MTATEPTPHLVPVANEPAGLSSRQAVTPPPAAPVHVGAFKPENIQMAEMMARAGGDMLPASYVGNPGACLLALDYAERHGLSILEVTGQVAFRNGRGTPSARLQKKLAARQGYRTRKVSGDERSCTVAVINPDGEVEGEFEYTIELAESLGLLRNNLYNQDPAQMLFHRATTRALDQYGPSDLAGVFVEEYEEPDPVDVARQPEPVAEEVVEIDGQMALETSGDPTPDLAALVAANSKVTKAKVLKWAQGEWPEHDPPLTGLDALGADPQIADAAAKWIQEQ